MIHNRIDPAWLCINMCIVYEGREACEPGALSFFRSESRAHGPEWRRRPASLKWMEEKMYQVPVKESKDNTSNLSREWDV